MDSWLWENGDEILMEDGLGVLLLESSKFYAEFVQGNASGQHTFNAAVLALLGKYQAQDVSIVPEGQIVKLVDVEKSEDVATGILVHRDGRVGGKDLSKDKIVMRAEQLSPLPVAIQDAMLPFEITPDGRR